MSSKASNRICEILYNFIPKTHFNCRFLNMILKYSNMQKSKNAPLSIY